jgi:arylformamidase
VTAWPLAAPGARIVDLTHPLVGHAPTYPGQPASLFQTVATVADGGFLMSEIHSRSHVGTHADSPAHFIADGETTFTIGLQRWMGDAWVAKVPDARGPIEPGMLELPARPAHALLIATGHSRFWGTDRYYGQAPHLTVAAAEKIIDAGFGLVGLDFGSPDATGSPTEPCHHALLGAGVLIIENLKGLDEVHTDWCWFCAAPLLTGGGDGGFCRAFAAVLP